MLLRLAHRDFGVLGQVRPHKQAIDTEQVLVPPPSVELQVYLCHLLVVLLSVSKSGLSLLALKSAGRSLICGMQRALPL